jgi:hypothetical protein
MSAPILHSHAVKPFGTMTVPMVVIIIADGSVV